ncbi:unnamed protein product [Sphagnum balticum]
MHAGVNVRVGTGLSTTGTTCECVGVTTCADGALECAAHFTVRMGDGCCGDVRHLRLLPPTNGVTHVFLRGAQLKFRNDRVRPPAASSVCALCRHVVG